MLEDKMPGITIGQRARGVTVLAYADDVTVFVTRPAEFITILNALQLYQRATGARLNPKKSKTLAIGSWKVPATELGIEFCTRVKILGVTFETTIENSTNKSWACVIRAVRAQARKAYAINLCLVQRMQFVQLYLLAKIWHVSQMFPPLKVHTQQLTICTWFIWQGVTFRVPVTTLQRPKDQGGWALPDIAVKYRTLLLSRIWILSAREGSVTPEWM
jgi:hypothetical protein